MPSLSPLSSRHLVRRPWSTPRLAPFALIGLLLIPALAAAGRAPSRLSEEGSRQTGTPMSVAGAGVDHVDIAGRV